MVGIVISASKRISKVIEYGSENLMRNDNKLVLYRNLNFYGVLRMYHIIDSGRGGVSRLLCTEVCVND